MGVRRTTDFLEKATWTLATGLIVLTIVACLFVPKQEVEAKSKIGAQIEDAIDPSQVQQFPTVMPQVGNESETNE